MINKRKIIYYLAFILIGLFFLNILLSLTKKKSTFPNSSFLSRTQIEEKFNTGLENCGIIKDWIRKVKIKKSKNDSLKFKYKINIPSDLPIPILQKELNEVFEFDKVKIKATEIRINGPSSLVISSGKINKLIADFSYSTKLSREYSSIAFLITDFESINDATIKDYFNSPTPYGVILPLITNSTILAEKVKTNGKEYFIELNDDSDNIDFELEKDIPLNKLNNNIKRIISSFNSPRVFFYDKNKSGFTLTLTNYIKERFNLKGRRILTLNNFVLLKGENPEDLSSLLAFHLQNLKFGDKKVFKINYEDWFSIEEQLQKFIKKGNKIAYPTELL